MRLQLDFLPAGSHARCQACSAQGRRCGVPLAGLPIWQHSWACGALTRHSGHNAARDLLASEIRRLGVAAQTEVPLPQPWSSMVAGNLVPDTTADILVEIPGSLRPN